MCRVKLYKEYLEKIQKKEIELNYIISELEKTEGFAWEHKRIDSMTEIYFQNRICKHFDFENGGICLLDKDKRPCSFFKTIEKEEEERRYGFLWLKKKTIYKEKVKSCPYNLSQFKSGYCRVKSYIQSKKAELKYLYSQ